MKKVLPLVMIWIIFFSSNLLADEKKDILENACCSYILALKSDRCCLVKSAMINLIRFYYLYPKTDFDKILIELDDLVQNASSEENRFIARLVRGYIRNEINLDWLMKFEYEQIYHYFSICSAKESVDLARNF